MSSSNQSYAQCERPRTDAELAKLIPWPKQDANKYSRGKLIVIAGSDRYPGAALLASRAAQRSGAGYTEVVSAPSARNLVLGHAPSLVVHSFADWNPGELAGLQHRKPCAICIGPGFAGDSAFEFNLVNDTLTTAPCPVLVDGGALGSLTAAATLLALEKRARAGKITVLTPHGGEAARLAGHVGIQSTDAASLSAKLACALNSIIVLKGPDTYVSNGLATYPMREGTPALAKAGTGDVLAGIIAALLAQGVEPMGASLLGATLHARAGIIAADTLTDISVLPEDIIETIPAAIVAIQTP